MENSEYQELFLAEAQEYLQTLNSCLLQLEQDPRDHGNLTEMFRVMHSLKGMAGTMGYDKIMEVAHVLENFLEEMRSETIAPSTEKVELLFDGLDLLQRLMENPGDPSESNRNAADQLVEQVKEVSRREAAGEAPPVETRAAEKELGFSAAGDLQENPGEREEAAAVFDLDESQQEILRTGLAQGGRGYRIEVTLKEGAVMKSVRAYMVLQALDDFGEVVATVPSMNQLDQEKFDRSFSVGLVAPSQSEEELVEELRETLLNITEVEEVSVYPWDAQAELERAASAATGGAPSGSEEQDHYSSGGVSSSGEDSLELDEMEKETLKAGLRKGKETRLVKVKLKEGAMLKSVRAYMALRALEDYGEVLVTSPSMQDLDEENFEWSFLAGVMAEDFPEEQIKGSLLNITEVEEVEILPWSPPQEGEETPDSSSQETAGAAPEELVPQGEKPEGASREKASSRPSAESGGEKPAGKKQGAEAEAQSSRVMEKTVRVETAKLDELINLVGEMVINRTQVLELGKDYTENLDRSLEQLDRITGDLQNAAMKLRMVPIRLVFERFPRMVRDISREKDKQVQLFISGEDTELDRSLINQLSDPLVHLLRNAIDHGVEEPEERKRKGKPVRGNIYLGAHHEGSHVVIQVEDDGKGLEPEKLKESAVEKGLISWEEASKMKEEEAYQLIFHSGFSTSEEVSEVSGRGVGMDAVKSNIESMQGSVEVKSEIDEGSRFVLRLPLTLAIIKALMVEVADEMYAIPIENIRENIFLTPDQIKTIQKGWVANLREEVIPIYFMSDLLGFHGMRKEAEEYSVVVIETAEETAGLIVDQMAGQQEVVIKSLGGFLKEIKGIAGATVLGDGRVSLIIDAVGLLENGRVDIVQDSVSS